MNVLVTSHYQKRFGKRLRKKKKDVKGLSRKDHLTDAKIDTLRTISPLLCIKTLGTLTK